VRVSLTVTTAIESGKNPGSDTQLAKIGGFGRSTAGRLRAGFRAGGPQCHRAFSCSALLASLLLGSCEHESAARAQPLATVESVHQAALQAAREDAAAAREDAGAACDGGLDAAADLARSAAAPGSFPDATMLAGFAEPRREILALRGPSGLRAGPAGMEAPAPLRAGGEAVARGRAGLVVSVEEQATRVGVSVLEAGGNAVDAAVATAYALAVTHPSAGNLGGGGFMLIALRERPVVSIDFRERAPQALTEAHFRALLDPAAHGPAASGVPGSVAGLNLAEQRYGRLSLAQVIEPAIALANAGHRVSEREALTLRWAWRKLNSAARRQFSGPHGAVRAGDWLVRADLGRTLERIVESGDAGFYDGETARAIVRAMGDVGLIRAHDLREYHAVERPPVVFRYAGYDVFGMPPPSWGGLTVAQITLGLAKLDARRFPEGSADELHVFAELARRAQAERRFDVEGLGPDPDAISAEQLAEQVRRFERAEVVPPLDLSRATPSRRIHPGYMALEREPDHTTQLSVIDADGNAVSCTTTLSAGFGAGYVVPTTGIVMNNSLAAFSGAGSNLPEPGRRMRSSMDPTLVLRAGRVAAVLGSPGGETIPSTVVQVLRNLIDYGMTLDRAIEAPRIHQSFVPDELRIERDRPLAADVLAELRARGHALISKVQPIGAANNLLVVDGTAYGHADSREGGLALAARPRKAQLDARR
jgi:gamma-glutamyltranspeptidase/glutathione hydrolase